MGIKPTFYMWWVIYIYVSDILWYIMLCTHIYLIFKVRMRVDGVCTCYVIYNRVYYIMYI